MMVYFDPMLAAHQKRVGDAIDREKFLSWRLPVLRRRNYEIALARRIAADAIEFERTRPVREKRTVSDLQVLRFLDRQSRRYTLGDLR